MRVKRCPKTFALGGSDGEIVVQYRRKTVAEMRRNSSFAAVERWRNGEETAAEWRRNDGEAEWWKNGGETAAKMTT